MKLYPHQQKAKRAVFAALKRDVRRQLIVLPTGGGKTVVFSHVIKSLPGRTLVLAHRDELLTQAHDTIKAVMPRASVGFVRAGVSETSQRIIVASVQALARKSRLDAFPDDFDNIIVDEAHHAEAPTYQRIINHFSDRNPFVLGVTATPFRGRKPLGIFDETVYNLTLADGVREGWLSDVEGKLIHLKDADFSKIHTENGDLNLSELEIIMRASNWHEYVSRAYFEQAAGRKTIIFVPKVAMAHELADWMRGQGAKAEAIDGAMDAQLHQATITAYQEVHPCDDPTHRHGLIFTAVANSPAVRDPHSCFSASPAPLRRWRHRPAVRQ